MSFQTRIRPAEPVDIADIRRVARAAWHTVYDDILGEETVNELLSEGYAPPVLEQMIDLEEVGLFVSTADGDIVGYASCGMTDSAGFGDLDLYVHPDYWGEGIGSELLSQGEQHLRELSVRKIRDEVLAENEVGNAFYRKHFEKVDERTSEVDGKELPVNVYERRV
ncbi:GNAT family N-acetyltransferase [Haloarcula sp. 1CSR25-25]|uniref:GNAT family N-acetyltransferase n=1 Tax=Haloarcula sp. 1CSR25-25 TaxID=2862545 RepID=UPI0028939AEE|nr:GNAT family N-acetyltransferase [Haloarcula sp. 1CSR25-25]MDT3436148.1 GNAT family N-acetyltransferase [Haloarcula sp. 1CSR25-25]